MGLVPNIVDPKSLKFGNLIFLKKMGLVSKT